MHLYYACETSLARNSCRGVLTKLSFLAALLFLLRVDGAAISYNEIKPGLWYGNLRVRSEPWSLHVVKIDKARPDFQLTTTLGGGVALGLNPITDQIASVPAQLGHPIAAINGDFYQTENESSPGDPRGLQILRGELVSSPAPRTACFWIDAAGQPQATNVISQLKVTWPGGTLTPFGLNEERRQNGAVLFTPAFGARTETPDGRELILERDENAPWLPLRPGQIYSARVRAVREVGNNRISRDTMVLSLGPALAARLEPVKPGAVLKLSTATTPSLAGVEVAIGGGPVLLREGKIQPVNVNKAMDTHPRSALGWNDKFLFFVEVDGRQRLSRGMTLPELAAFLVELGCDQAMNLDGGGSAEVWVDGKIVNNPCYGHERNTANALVLLQRENKAGSR
ncbi:MAG: phosphodiester glycosidase family protein [Verrucomicrobia bacterium]|nr:phosphodiester glycosidase family protein [Verrucomicrobiota bacterium]